MKTRYKFSHRAGGFYYWYSGHVPGDSRVEQIKVSVEFFWSGQMCGSRGPRIGDEGQPICKRPKGHDGMHRPSPSDGWGSHMVWGLRMPDGSLW